MESCGILLCVDHCVPHSLPCQWCGQRRKVFFASKDTSERSVEPRGRGAFNGVLGARRRTEGRSGEPEAATSLHSPNGWVPVKKGN